MNHSTHILIVDDDQGIRELLCEFLQQHGFEVHVAKNGDQMRANLNAHPIDLIILDIMMPGEDGMTLCKAVRQSSQVPIIMLTAVTEDIEHILALEIGADDFINKPFNPRTLLARIKAVLRRAQGEPDAEHEDDHNHKSYSLLNKNLASRANTGFAAIFDLLKYDLKELYITGFSFYLDSFLKGYKDGCQRNEEVFSEECFNSARHNQNNQWEYLKKNISNKRITFDPVLKEILNMNKLDRNLFHAIIKNVKISNC